MEFKEGTEVVTADGDRMGRVERVIIDPLSKDVEGIIVEKGLFADDKVVPIALIESATAERVRLRGPIDDDLENLPDFEEYDFMPLTPADQGDYPAGYPRPMYWYPSQGIAWWENPGLRGIYSRPAFVVQQDENIPEGTVALKEGASVISADGEHVGDVERVLTDPGEERATHLVIAQGVLFTERKLVPTTWINSVQEDRVLLAVGSTLLDRVRGYED